MNPKTKEDSVTVARSTLWALKGTSNGVFEAEFGDALHGLEVETLRHAIETINTKIAQREKTALEKFGYVDSDLRVYLEGVRYAVSLMERELNRYPDDGFQPEEEES